ncbi:MAG TPA: choice-of-anchor tandem repeat GloVer-containing protein [Steroidobacteraceae bacterium]|nr:choice-of-anchor tandem repeat GloVer-containing protein [Steroidobacteraceae bacterium]
MKFNLTGFIKKISCALGIATGLLAAPIQMASADTADTSLFYANVMTFYINKPVSGVTEVPFNGRIYLFGTFTSGSDYGIYRVATDGTGAETIYQFTEADGVGPTGNLMLASDSRLYGLTRFGTAVGRNTSAGSGTIYSIDQNGKGYTTLHSFDALVKQTDASTGISFLANNDGALNTALPAVLTSDWFDGSSFQLPVPQQLIEGGDSFVYGVTPAGGANGTGTIFRMRRDGTNFQVLHTFAGINYLTGFTKSFNHDGAFPSSSLLLDIDSGYLYGVTRYGGDSGNGTVYRLQPDGTGFQTIYSFEPSNGWISGVPLGGTTDTSNCHGGLPVGRPIIANGMLFGTTARGGNDSANCDGNSNGDTHGYGLVYAIRLSDIPPSDVVDYFKVINVHNFDGTNGSSPYGDLVLGADGALIYGESVDATNRGAVFSIDTNNLESGFNLGFQYLNSSVGTPSGSLFLARDGNFYGVALEGGECSGASGAVYQLRQANTPPQQGYVNCVNPYATSNSNSLYGGGGGAMNTLFLVMLSTLGLALPLKRRAGLLSSKI